MDAKHLGWKADRSKHTEILFSFYYQCKKNCNKPKEAACLAFFSSKGCYSRFSSWRLSSALCGVAGVRDPLQGPRRAQSLLWVTAAIPLASNDNDKQGCWVKNIHLKFRSSDPHWLWDRLGSKCSRSTQTLWVITLPPQKEMVLVVGSWKPHRGSQDSACLFQPEGAFSVEICRSLSKPTPGLMG